MNGILIAFAIGAVLFAPISFMVGVFTGAWMVHRNASGAS